MRQRSAFRGLALAGTALTLIPAAWVTPVSAATCTWLGGTGDWSVAGQWSCGTTPGSGDDVLIDGGNPVSSVVTVASGQQANTVTLDSGDTLAISNARLGVYGSSFTNNGAVTIGNGGDLYTGSGSLTLGGTGTVVLTDTGTGQPYIYGDGALTIGSGQVISGTGNIGENAGLITNAGVIDANQVNGYALYLDAQGGSGGIGGGLGAGGAAAFLNTGTLEATGGGNLVFYSGQYDNGTIGQIVASGANSTVTLSNDVRIIGGTLTASAGGAIDAVSNGTQFLQGVRLSSGSTVSVSNDTVYLDGAITNNGTFAVGSSGTLYGDNGTTSITGNGTITLTDVGAGGAYLYSNGTMTIGAGQTVRGSGYVADNSGVFVNNGVIDASLPGQYALNVDAQGGSGGVGTGLGTDGNAAFLNNGTMEATAGGNLVLVSGLYDNGTTGRMIASGTGSTLTLGNDVRIVGGALTSNSGGAINAINNGTQYLEGVTLTSGSTVNITADTVYLDGSFTNNGTVAIGSSGTLYGDAGAVTINGTGTITLTDVGAGGAYLYSGGTTTIGAGQTVQGSGYVAANSGVLVNNGVIDADLPGQYALNLDAQGGSGGIGGGVGTNGASAFLNNNLVEATGGGNLVLVSGLYENAGAGEMLATGAGSTITLGNDAAILNGTLASANGGAINAINNGTQYLTGVTLAGGSNLTIGSDNVYLASTFTNNGAVAIGSSGSLIGNGAPVTVGGTGSIVLGDVGNGAAYLYSYSTMTLGSGQTVSGAGNVGANSGIIVNNGVIDANATAGYGLILDAQGGSGGIGAGNGVGLNGDAAFLNTNLVEATGGGTLTLNSGLYENGPTGRMVADGAGSTISLLNDARVVGGTLTSSNGGAFVANSQGTQYLQDVTLTAGSNLDVTADTVQIQNTFTNNGSVTLASGTLYGASAVNALNGTGTVSLDGNSLLYGGGTLTIGAGETVRGSGNVGANTGLITNNGTIASDGGLVIDAQGGSGGVGGGLGTSGTVAFLNGSTGIVAATTGTLTLVSGQYENGGAFTAASGATFDMDNDANLTNIGADGTLNGGRYEADTGALMTLRSAQAGAITRIGTDAGPATMVTLSGAGSLIQAETSGGSLPAALDASLQGTGASGTLALSNGRAFVALAGPFTNAGTLALSSGASFAAPGGFSNSGTVTGNGTVGTPITNTGTVVANGGTLYSQAITGPSGTIQTNSGATLNLASALGASTAGYLTNNGNLALGANDITVTSDYQNANFRTGGGFDAHADVTGSGRIYAVSATQDLSGPGLNLQAGTLNVGNVRLGGSSSTTLTVTNNGTATTLRGAVVAGNGSTVTINGADFVVGPNGGHQTVTLSYTGDHAGSLAGQTVVVANNFDNVADQTLSLQGAAYRVASAQLSPNPIDLGVTRVGGTLAGNVTISNTDPADGYSESLAVTSATGANGASGTAPSGLIAAGNSALSQVALDASTSGVKSGTVTYGLATNGQGTSGLAQEAIASQTETVNGIVTQVAAPVITDLNHIGTLSGSGDTYMLDLGTLTGSGSVTVDLGVLNDIPDSVYAELLNGYFTDDGGAGFVFASTGVSGLHGGDTAGDNELTFTYSDLMGGDYSDLLTFHGSSHYDGLDDLALTPINISVSASVTPASTQPGSVPEPTTWWMMVAGFGLLGTGIRRARRVAVARSLRGRSLTNTTGPGTFAHVSGERDDG